MSVEWLKKKNLDKKAKRLLEDNIPSDIATWDSLKDDAVLKEHFRDVARGIKKPERWTGN